MDHSAPRIAILGLGAIGRNLLVRIQSSILPGVQVAALVRAGSDAAAEPAQGVDIFNDTDALLHWKPDLAIECAGHEVVRSVAPLLLQAGVDVIIVSLCVLGDAALRESLEAAARAGRAHWRGWASPGGATESLSGALLRVSARGAG